MLSPSVHPLVLEFTCAQRQVLKIFGQEILVGAFPQNPVQGEAGGGRCDEEESRDDDVDKEYDVGRLVAAPKLGKLQSFQHRRFVVKILRVDCKIKRMISENHNTMP
jgi:hypothetical protein